MPDSIYFRGCSGKGCCEKRLTAHHRESNLFALPTIPPNQARGRQNDHGTSDRLKVYGAMSFIVPAPAHPPRHRFPVTESVSIEKKCAIFNRHKCAIFSRH